MGRTHFHVLALCIASSLAVSACLPDGKDPSEGADTGKANAAYYASTLGNVAIRIQDTIIRDPSWFAKSESSEFNLQAHDIDQPNGLGADIRAAVCFAGGDNNVTQLTWIDGKDESGRFSMKVLGKGAGKIATELRKSIGANQIGTYKGNGTLAMADGSFGFIPTGCRSSELPIGTPVVVFDIDHPAAPLQETSRTEYRAKPCEKDGVGNARRGTMVQSRVVTFKPNGGVSPADAESGWRTESLGTCVDDVNVRITNQEVLPGGGMADISSFAQVNLKDILAAQIANMNCTKVSVKREGGGQHTTANIDTCGNTTAHSGSVVVSDDAGEEYDYRELSCVGTSPNRGSLGNLPDTPSVITWEQRDPFTNKIILKRLASKRTLGSKDGLWSADRIDCSGIENAALRCAQVPSAPNPFTAESERVDTEMTGYEPPTNAPFNVAWSRPSIRVLDQSYFDTTSLAQNGGIEMQRNVSAVSWKDAASFTPNISGEEWQMIKNECSWTKLEMGNCPAEFEPELQGTWYPTADPDQINWTAATTEALVAADERAVLPEWPDTGFLAQTRPWTIDTPVTSEQAEASAAAWIFRDLQRIGANPLRVRTAFGAWPDAEGSSPTPGYLGEMRTYLKRWMTSSAQPNIAIFERAGSGRMRVANASPISVQTTLLNTQGVRTTYKPAMTLGGLSVTASAYKQPLYCARSEERVTDVPLKHYGCNGTLIEESIVKVTFSTYRRYRATAANAGSWSKPIYSYSLDQTLDGGLKFAIKNSAQGAGGRFDRALEAGSRYVTAEGDPIYPRDGFVLRDECAPEPSGDFCPALTTPSCGPGEMVVNIPIFQPGGARLGNCTQNVCAPVTTPPVVTPTPVQCPAVTQPVCTGFTHFVASPNDANGCATAGTCVRNACPSLTNVPQSQADCDRQEWNMGPALWYVDGGVDANGCARGGSCHQETFSECAYRNGWNGTDPNVPYGCCNVYAPGTGGACNINGEYTPYGY